MVQNRIKATDYYELIKNTVNNLVPEDYPVKLYFIKGTVFERAAIKDVPNISCVRNIDKATHIVYANLKTKHIIKEEGEVYYNLTSDEVETISVLGNHNKKIIEVNVIFDYIFPEYNITIEELNLKPLKDSIFWNKKLVNYYKENLYKYKYITRTARQNTILNKYKNYISTHAT